MPLIPHIPTPIEVSVSDRKVNDTTIKQKAVFQRLEHRIAYNDEARVAVTVLVELYAADGDSYGEKLVGPGFAGYTVELVADNQTIVDVTTGEILAINTGYKSKMAWEAEAQGYEQPVMFQGDFFELIRDNQPIVIGDLIRQHIAQADAMGKFA
jgi:hypothetical protein